MRLTVQVFILLTFSKTCKMFAFAYMHVASFQNIVKVLNMKLNQWLVQHIITCGRTPGFARKLQK